MSYFKTISSSSFELTSKSDSVLRARSDKFQKSGNSDTDENSTKRYKGSVRKLIAINKC